MPKTSNCQTISTKHTKQTSHLYDFPRFRLIVMWILCTIVVHTGQAHDSTHATQAWISCGLEKVGDVLVIPSMGMDTYPTKREVWKIIDSNMPFLGDMIVLVPWRVLLLCSTSEAPRPYVLHISHASTAAWACSGVLITGKIKPQRKCCAMTVCL